MLSLIMKDRGSNFHCKITDEDFEQAKKELAELRKNPEELYELYDIVINLIQQYSGEFEWFDINALRNAGKENLLEYVYLLARSYEIRLEKDGLIDKYGFDKDLNPTKKELSKFEKFFVKREAIGTRFFYAWGGNWTVIFSRGFQLSRLVLGPFGIIAAKIPFVALGYFIFWVGAAMFDWIAVGIPYLILKSSSGLPGDYYNSDLLLSSYVLGNTTNAKKEVREIVKNDKANVDAYDAALWGLYMREKWIEIVRKERKN